MIEHVRRLFATQTTEPEPVSSPQSGTFPIVPNAKRSSELDAYIQTYTSLLESSAVVRVAALEEAHIAALPYLHPFCAHPEVHDICAFGYGAMRLPALMPWIRHVYFASSHEQFERAGLGVGNWKRLHARGRSRAFLWDGCDRLAIFIASQSDIDDLVPMLTAYQLEWNKFHDRLRQCSLGHRLLSFDLKLSRNDLEQEFQLSERMASQLIEALGSHWQASLAQIADRPSALSLRLLTNSHTDHRRAAYRWWRGVESEYQRVGSTNRKAIYFVSSSTQMMSNLVGGFARSRRDEIIEYVRSTNHEGLRPVLDRALAERDQALLNNLIFYVMRAWAGHDERIETEIRDESRSYEADGGVLSIDADPQVDPVTQVVDISQIRPERLDPRLWMPDIHRLATSDAVIINVDHPRGMAAYHHLMQTGEGTSEVRGVYFVGKSMMLSGHAGNVAVPSTVRDDHSGNTYVIHNCFSAGDVQPLLDDAHVFDNQKAVTVRGSLLQNYGYLAALQREGATILDTESGPYLSAVYELSRPERHPTRQTVVLEDGLPFEVGVLHCAVDTLQSKRQNLSSTSQTFLGVASTTACSIAILRRILAAEIDRTWTSAM